MVSPFLWFAADVKASVLSKSIMAYESRGPLDTTLPPADPTLVGVPGSWVSGGVGQTMSVLGNLETGVAGAVVTKCVDVVVVVAGVAAGVETSKSRRT